MDIKPIGKYDEAVARHCFTSEEFNLFTINDNPDRLFYELWTRKKCIMKATFQGLQLDPLSFTVLPPVNIPHEIDGEIWPLYSYSFDGHLIAVAAKESQAMIDMVFVPKQNTCPLSII